MKYIISLLLALVSFGIGSIVVNAETPPLSDMSTVYDGQPVVGIDNSTVVMSGMDFVYNAQPIVGIVSTPTPPIWNPTIIWW
jgi:hypothetical protein